MHSRAGFLFLLSIIFKTIVGVLKHEDVAVNTEEIDEGYLDEIRGVAYGK